eukprot:13198512-Alexandrium_andersonii.AAC.1
MTGGRAGSAAPATVRRKVPVSVGSGSKMAAGGVWAVGDGPASGAVAAVGAEDLSAGRLAAGPAGEAKRQSIAAKPSRDPAALGLPTRGEQD